ncbi:hypothetical protein Tco_0987000 [Tanacetum coccineum]
MPESQKWEQQQHAVMFSDELCPQKAICPYGYANNIAASASVPWIYMAQFWHTLKEDGSKHRLKFLLDRKELTLTLDDFRTIFHLPQANDNNHASFVPPPSFSDMPWQTLCKIFSKCLTTRVTGWDQPPLQIMQMLYCFVNNIHVDYAELIRARDAYHNLQDDDIMKNIFNSGRNKNKVGMRIPAWMITDEMKLTEHYKMYAEVFGLDVPLTQSQPTESTQGTHRIPSAPRSPNPAMETAESSVLKRSTVIRFRLPSRQSARLTPPVPVPSAEKADEMILQDMIQVSLAEHKSREEQEARENVALVYEHLAAEEIEKLVEDPENVDDSSPPRHDDTSIPGTRLEPRSDKESPEVEIVQEKEEETTKDTEVEPDKDTPMVDVTNIVPPVNVDDEEDEITDEVFELRRRAKGKNVEESRISTIHSPTRSPRNFSTLVSSDTEKLQELMVTHPKPSTTSINSAKRQNTSEYKAYVSGESSSGQDNAEEPGPSTSSNQEQDDEFDFWTESYASDDDEIPTKQMKNFLQSDIVWESRKEILVSPHPQKITPLVQSFQRDSEAPALSLINQDLLYLKKGNSGPKNIVLSLHKFPAIVFDDDDIEERTSRWVNKCIKKFNPYARYGVEN